MQSFELADWTELSIPTAGFFTEQSQYALENHGVDVDVEVEYTPQSHRAGVDPQLEEAIRIAQQQLALWKELRPAALQ